MHWQEAVLKSPSKRAVRQNKVNIYVRYELGGADVLYKKHSGIRKAMPQEVEGFDDWITIEEYNAQQSVHADAGDSAVSTSSLQASALSTSQAEPTPTQRG